MRLITFVVFVFLIVACSGDDNKKKTPTVTNEDQPTATIEFPSNHSISEHASVFVRGSAVDSDGIESVTVNGQPALLEGEQWQIRLDLQPGSNTVQVDVTDTLGATTENAANITLNFNGPQLFYLTDYVLDEANQKLYFVNTSGSFPLLQYDIATQGLSPVSLQSDELSDYRVDAWNTRIALNGDSSRLFMLDDLNRVLQADLTSNVLSTLSTPEQSSDVYSGIENGALDPSSNAGIVLDSGILYRVDFTNGSAMQIADTNQSIGNCNEAAVKFIINTGANPATILYAGNNTDVVYSLSLDGADCDVFSPADVSVALGTTGVAMGPWVIDEASNQLIAYNTANSQFAAISLDDGSRAYLQDSIGATVSIPGLTDVTLDVYTPVQPAAPVRRLLLLRPVQPANPGDPVAFVDALNISDMANITLSSDLASINVQPVKITANNATVYFHTNETNAQIFSADISVQGQTTAAVSLAAVGDLCNTAGVSYAPVQAMMFEASEVPRLVNFYQRSFGSSIAELTFETAQAQTVAACTIVSTPAIGDTSVTNSASVSVDGGGNRLLVTDRNGQLIGINLTDGERSIISNQVFPSADNYFTDYVYGTEVDVDSNNLISADRDGNVIATSLNSATLGQRTLITDDSQNPNVDLGSITGLTLGTAGTIFVSTNDEIIRISPDGQQQTVIADNTDASLPQLEMYSGISSFANKIQFNSLSSSPVIYAQQYNSGILRVDVAGGDRSYLPVGFNTYTENFSSLTVYNTAKDALYFHGNPSDIYVAQLGDYLEPGLLVNGAGDESNPIPGGITEMELDPDGRNLYVLYYDRFDGGYGIARIDTETGQRTVISGTDANAVVHGGGDAFNNPFELMINNDGIYVVQDGQTSAYGVLGVDIETGQRTMVDIVFDDEVNVYEAIATPSGHYLLTRNTLFRLDPATGVTTRLYSNWIGDPNGFIKPSAVDYVPETDSLLIYSDERSIEETYDNENLVVEVPLSLPQDRRVLITADELDSDIRYQFNFVFKRGDSVILANEDWGIEYDLISKTSIWLYNRNQNLEKYLY